MKHVKKSGRRTENLWFLFGTNLAGLDSNGIRCAFALMTASNLSYTKVNKSKIQYVRLKGPFDDSATQIKCTTGYLLSKVSSKLTLLRFYFHLVDSFSGFMLALLSYSKSTAFVISAFPPK